MLENLPKNLPEIRIERRKGQRTLRMRLHEDHVMVSAPARVSQAEIEQFIFGHTDWIEKKWAEMQRRMGALHQTIENNRGAVFLRGKWTPVVALSVGGRSEELVEMPEKAVLKTPNGKWNGKTLTKALKVLAAKELPKEVKRIATQTGTRFTDVTVRSQKSRWGSCSSSGALNLNWRLIKCPPLVRDYVIVHELAHTLVFNHSQAFWDAVHRMMPEYRKALEWISENSALVFAQEPEPK